jgi:hypothetical protein
MVERATLEGPVTVGALSPPAEPRSSDLDAVGYVQEEFFASGMATSFVPDGEGAGDWSVTAGAPAPYTTRLLVRRPRDPERFGGTVVVEWMNVTVVETAPEWAYTDRAIIDAGAAWVGVSVQALGVEGGRAAIQTGDEQQEVMDHGLRANNPERYAALAHPGDAYCYDMFSQIGDALRAPDARMFGGRTPTAVIGVGESQSAWYLTTYVNAVHPVADVFDGFLVHSRGASAAALDGTRDRESRVPVRFRSDLDAAVMTFQTETDVGPVYGYAGARQSDTDRLRVWEVAGTAHADAFLVGVDFALCGHSINSGPQHYVLTAALEALMRWVVDGVPPPRGPRIRTVSELDPTIVRDEHGNALGGIRTPPLDVPAATLSGEPPDGADVLCSLFGVTIPFDHATLTSLYGDRQAYLDAFDVALDEAIEAGFVRAADRPRLAAEARDVEF